MKIIHIDNHFSYENHFLKYRLMRIIKKTIIYDRNKTSTEETGLNSTLIANY